MPGGSEAQPGPMGTEEGRGGPCQSGVLGRGGHEGAPVPHEALRSSLGGRQMLKGLPPALTPDP